MTTRHSECPNCGHLFSDEHPYYSEDFAAWYSIQPSFLLQWCYHCTYVSSYVQPSFIKFIKLPVLRLKCSVPIRSVDDEPLWKTEDKKLGLFAGAHLMRMVWHCLNASIELEHGESESKENVVHLALKKLPPREVALMIYVTSLARDNVPRKQQIQEGVYIEDSIPIPMPLFEQWVSSSPKKDAVSGTIETLNAFKQR